MPRKPSESTTCTKCDQPRKPRLDRPGKFFTLCENHLREYKRLKANEYYPRRKEEMIERAQVYYWNNFEVIRRKAKESDPLWKKKNREAIRLKKILRRTRVGHYTMTQIQDRISFYGNLCYLCGCDLTELDSFDQTLDHVIPIAKGGTNWPANLRPACRSCNAHKRARALDEVLV